MKPPTQAIIQTLFLLLVVGQIAQEVIAFHAGSNNHHHDTHHQGHHEGKHHASSHHGHHGVRAPRTRREREPPADQKEKDDQAGMTASWAHEPLSCDGDAQCSGTTHAICDPEKKICSCPLELPIYDYSFEVCVKEAKLNTLCEYTSECEEGDEYSLCSQELKKCICKDGFNMEEYPDVGFQCVHKNIHQGAGKADPAMIGVLVAMAIMFVIICVVLRLFSKARFRENRSIFNTPNPRLMNASLFKDSGVAGRRGSAMSAVSATGSAAPSGGAAPKTPSPAKEPKTKSETTVAIENVD